MNKFVSRFGRVLFHRYPIALLATKSFNECSSIFTSCRNFDDLNVTIYLIQVGT